MNYQDVLQAIGIVALSGLKFLGGIIWACASEFGFFPAVILTISGGMIGVFVFAFAEKAILRYYQKKNAGLKVRITKYKRWLVGLKKSIGLTGIALLTPILLQVPIGTLLAMRLIKNTKKVSLYMLGAFVFYSFLLCGLYYYLGFDLSGFFGRLSHGII